ncbi:helix-hairpin-helix domain-containing protein [Pseudarthrobacter sp. N5]|uniref:helix-hairpin-helix domain-containing protein n=1 Tax=Pseudarthrobacter sp. N5 TaxID=3418416 RepID=UPI003CF92B0A
MPRRDTAASAGHPARRAQSRLRASLGHPAAGLLDAGEGQPEFTYGRSGAHARVAGQDSHKPADLPAGTALDASHGGGNTPAAATTAGAGLRWRLGLRAAVLMGIVSLLLGCWFWWQVSTAHTEVIPLSGVTATDGGSTGEAADGQPPPAGAGPQDSGGPDHPESPATRIVVHVAGAVSHPGVVELPQGSRIHTAIEAAGGHNASADLDRLNLAAILKDGQKIYVPQPGEVLPEDAVGGPAGGGSGTDAGAPAAGSLINLNTAGLEELGTLPRVGPVLAQRILDWRKDHGPFKAVEELDAVDGVGPKMLETLIPLVRI